MQQNVKVAAHNKSTIFHTPLTCLTSEYCVLYIYVLYEHIYFSMHVQVKYNEHLQCCSFN